MLIDGLEKGEADLCALRRSSDLGIPITDLTLAQITSACFFERIPGLFSPFSHAGHFLIVHPTTHQTNEILAKPSYVLSQ